MAEAKEESTDGWHLQPLLVKTPGVIGDKHKHYEFAIGIRYVGVIQGFKYPIVEVWVADSNKVRRVFVTDCRRYPRRKV